MISVSIKLLAASAGPLDGSHGYLYLSSLGRVHISKFPARRETGCVRVFLDC